MKDNESVADLLREKGLGIPPADDAAPQSTASDGREQTDEEKAKPKSKSAATRLIELVEESGAELFHDAENAAFARIFVDNHWEVWPINVKTFRRWLNRQFFLAEGRAPGSKAVQDALTVLEGQACFAGSEHPVHVRLAEFGDKIYLDLADADWRVVEVSANGWQIIDDAPVRFQRPKGLKPLPAPVSGGTVEELRQYVNIGGDENWVLLVCWSIQALRPRGPYPPLILSGQQGSAKTTLSRVVRALIDPNVASLRSAPKDARDLMLAAKNAWCPCFDNLSSLKPWLSDAFCRLATGDGFSTRMLFTDDEEAIFEAMRPVILNGITDVATRSDLIERAIALNLPTIPEHKRRIERTFWKKFEQARPRILGALLTVLSGAMRCLPGVRLDSPPRMADFAEFAVATETALGWPSGTFLSAYSENRSASNTAALEASPLTPYVVKVVEEKGDWEGTATELLKALGQRAGESET